MMNRSLRPKNEAKQHDKGSDETDKDEWQHQTAKNIEWSGGVIANAAYFLHTLFLIVDIISIAYIERCHLLVGALTAVLAGRVPSGDQIVLQRRGECDAEANCEPNKLRPRIEIYQTGELRVVCCSFEFRRQCKIP